MTIKFTTTDGRTVETTDKNVLFEAARKGEIIPETMVDIDGRIGVAGQIKGMEFGAAKATTAPATPETREDALPPKTKKALDGLRNIAYAIGYVSAIIGFFVVAFAISEENFLFAGFTTVRAIIGVAIAYSMLAIIDITEDFACAAMCKNDKK